jgi:hypothetical protein
MSRRSVLAAALGACIGCASTPASDRSDGAGTPLQAVPPSSSSAAPVHAAAASDVAPTGGGEESEPSQLPPPPPPPDPRRVAECMKLFHAAGAAGAAVRKRHLRCAVDGDCVASSTPGVCQLGVGCGSGVSRAEQAQSEAEEVAAQKPHCDAWDARGCRNSTPIPIPSCPPVTAFCNHGKCDARY